jgi:hypothetical protein
MFEWDEFPSICPSHTARRGELHALLARLIGADADCHVLLCRGPPGDCRVVAVAMRDPYDEEGAWRGIRRAWLDMRTRVGGWRGRVPLLSRVVDVRVVNVRRGEGVFLCKSES